MTADEILRRFDDEPYLRLSEEDWLRASNAWPVRERHDTMFAGDLLVVDTPAGPVAVEQPEKDERVLRRLEVEAIDEFVRGRLDTYERMWDGCGCRVQYYA